MGKVTNLEAFENLERDNFGTLAYLCYPEGATTILLSTMKALKFCLHKQLIMWGVHCSSSKSRHVNFSEKYLVKL